MIPENLYKGSGVNFTLDSAQQGLNNLLQQANSDRNLHSCPCTLIFGVLCIIKVVVEALAMVRRGRAARAIELV